VFNISPLSLSPSLQILGPRGLMPNPKLGTVTLAVKEAVLAARRGQAEFRGEKRGIVSAGVGKVSFGAPELRDNIRAMLMALYDARPEGFKGQYMRAAFLSTTRGAGLPLDLAVVDPSSPTFLKGWDGAPAAVAAGGGSAASAGAAATA
jgi:large subunit ribosomal protein L1